MPNAALVSIKLFKRENGEKIELSHDDLRGGNFSAIIVEEVWDAAHPDCPFATMGKLEPSEDK